MHIFESLKVGVMVSGMTADSVESLLESLVILFCYQTEIEVKFSSKSYVIFIFSLSTQSVSKSGLSLIVISD